MKKPNAGSERRCGPPAVILTVMEAFAMKWPRANHTTSSFQVILLGFLGLILLGALVLMLPVCSRDRSVTPFGDTLFTAVSASCVTGLIDEISWVVKRERAQTTS